MRVRIPRYTSNRKEPGAMRNTAEVGLPSHDRKPWMKEVYHETSFCMHCRLRALRLAGTCRLRLEYPGHRRAQRAHKAPPPPPRRANRPTSPVSSSRPRRRLRMPMETPRATPSRYRQPMRRHLPCSRQPDAEVATENSQYGTYITAINGITAEGNSGLGLHGQRRAGHGSRRRLPRGSR